MICYRLFLAILCAALSLAAAETASSAADARRELLAGRFENAARLYSEIVAREPENGNAWYGLVRAQLGLHRSHDVYASAGQAIEKSPRSAGAQAAAGLAAFRRGDLQQAQRIFQIALKIDPDYPGALAGLAAIESSVSRFKTARDLLLRAYKSSPDDPELMLACASTLQGEAHIAMLQAALARLDPSSEEARHLAVHIANDRAVAGRKLRRLVSPYQDSAVKLFRIVDGPSRPRGVGLAVRLNGRQTAHLLIDTGASGISISPRLAGKAGLAIISGQTSEVRGIGDEKAQASIDYMASELRIGDVVFADYPVSAFRSARSSDYDGLIGPDVLGRFLIRIDFEQLEMSLTARQDEPRPANADPEEPVDWRGPPAPGFYRVFRFGDHLAIPTLMNGGRSALFLIDSGSTVNLVDTETAREVSHVGTDAFTRIRGVQGEVLETSRANRITLQFAGFRQENPDLIAISLEKMSDGIGVGFGGILGMPVLGQLALTLDYREGAVRFDYRKPPGR